MNKKQTISTAIILFVVLVISALWGLNLVSPKITVPFAVLILSLIGAGAVGKATFESYDGDSKKAVIVFGLSTFLLLIFAAILAYSIFF